jgi:putative RNA 2'-phosphotransferase
MQSSPNKRISKLLSLTLRHEPQQLSLSLDSAGWTTVDSLLAGLRAKGHSVSQDDLLNIVAQCPKQRFQLSDDGLRIRAAQGHSVEVNLQYDPQIPPAILYHGTAASTLAAIRASGLQRRARHHVHLSTNTDTATQVGGRHGRPVLLTIRADLMHAAGHVFYMSNNGVWLVDEVPAQFISFPNE